MVRIRPTFLLPIGFIGKMRYPNTHDVPEGTKVEIVAHDVWGYYHYEVKFKSKAKSIEIINESGPFILHHEIDFGENGDLFYE